MVPRSLEVDRNKIPASYRDYLERLKEIGEAIEIEDEIDWNLELGAILRRAYETKAPQPIFNNVKGSPGMRAAEFGPTCSRTPGKKWRRLAIMLGLPEDATPVECQTAYINAKSDNYFPPKVLSNEQAPCKENIWVGDQVDLEKLPAPLLHDGDRGRYLQTAGCIVVRTPDGKWTNWSVSRAMVTGKNTMTGLWLPFQHNGLIQRMWEKEGKECPFSIAFGVPPVVATQISAAPPEYDDEYNYASSLWGAPIDMVKGETNDLLVPATSEIVLEGVVSNVDKSPEGPFGEFPGYMANETHIAPVVKINCVSFRNNPILPVTNPGIPIDSTHIVGAFFLSSDAMVRVKSTGLPIIDGMYLFESASHWFVIRVRDDWHHVTGYSVEEFIGKIAELYWTSHVGHSCSKIIVVGEDIAPDDPDQVVWAFATRNHPELGVFHYPQYASEGSGLQIYLDVATKMRGRGGLVVYSCLPIQEKVGHPLEAVLSFEVNYPLPVQDKVLANWTRWGFEAPGSMREKCDD